MSDSNYDVGYKKPPREHRFRKGASGNPKGRPRKIKADAQTLGEIILEETQRPITLIENGQPVELTVERALVRSAFVLGIKGKSSSLRQAHQLLQLAQVARAISQLPTAEEIRAMDPHDAAAAYKRVMQSS